MRLKFSKVQAGWYATADGRYAVVSDGIDYVSQRDCDSNGISAGIVGGEWAAVADQQGRLRDDHNKGEILSWFPTKRQAVGYLDHKYAVQRP